MPAAVAQTVLLVADPERVGELASALAAPLPQGELEVLVSSGGDDTIDLFHARTPPVVVITATLEVGDATSLIDTLRGMVPRANVAFVVIGDDTGPIRTPLDAMEMNPDRFVSRPLSEKAVRYAVQSALEADALRTTQPMQPTAAPPRTITEQGTGVGSAVPANIDDDPTAVARAAMRARWEALADSIGGTDEEDDDGQRERGGGGDRDDIVEELADEAAPLPPPILIHPRQSASDLDPHVAPMQAWRPGSTDVPEREQTLIIRGPDVAPAPAITAIPTRPRDDIEPPPLRSLGDLDPPPPPLRSLGDLDPPPLPLRSLGDSDPPSLRAHTTSEPPPLAISRTRSDPPGALDIASRGADDHWSEPIPLAELIDRTGDRIDRIAAEHLREELPGLDDFADELMVGRGMQTPPPLADELEDPDLIVPTPPLPEPPPSLDAGDAPDAPRSSGRDFARQLRAKMSMMAQRLFSGDSGSSQGVDLRPRHDHQTEIDLAALGEELVLAPTPGATEIERGIGFADARELTTSPGSWDTQVRERGLPDSGEIVRGVSDAAHLLAKVFVQSTTGRIGFRRGEVEKVVYVDQGRPVFASSNEPGDRMGELLVREGKITAAQYERCQTQVAQSGRRMGEILVDFGYLKRRELLPAVRRHVEDIVYSLFGWDHGHYLVTIDATPSSERIRLSRHPAALVLEGVRRKLDRSTLERLVGPASTVIEVRDKERLGGILNTADFTPEERTALAAFDGQADLAQIARAAGVDPVDILPLAWGLVVLGLATARRAELEVEEATALVGETDLAIDRERVRARWELVTEADYFALLGVRRDATGFEIRRAYQSARRDFAADGFPTDLRRELARELDDIATVLDEAFRVLRDDRLRVTYLSALVD